MPLTNIMPPPGVYRSGTDLQSANRWRDANLVRWQDGAMQPVGQSKQWFANADTTQVVRGMHAWASGNRQYVAVGSYGELWIKEYQAIPPYDGYNDITPSGLIVGVVNEGDTQAILGGNVITRATSWSLDNWGRNLVGCSDTSGTLYEWTPGTAEALQITGAPTGCDALIVTDERFLVALGASSGTRTVAWSDREDNTTWTPAATNEAGSFELNTNGAVMCAKRVRGKTLILTTTDAHSMTYVGPPYVFGFERVGEDCGVISRMAAASASGAAFWMGRNGFFAYDGSVVTELPCEVGDYVFNGIDGQLSKICAVHNSQFNEIWWFYPRDGATENSHYVSYNYKDNIWSIGQLARTSGAARDFGGYPVMSGTSGQVYEHEIEPGTSGASWDLAPYAESGPLVIGEGDQVMKVNAVMLDEKTQGDVELVFKARFYPQGAEYEYGPYSPTNPTGTRFSGRQVRLRLDTATAGTDWRVGNVRLDLLTGGRR